MTLSPDRPYNVGCFAPLREEVTARELRVTGKIPAELSGRYVRNGPNAMRPLDAMTHWFASPAMLHGVRLRDGRAEWYRARWIPGDDSAAALSVRPLPGPRVGPFGAGSPNTSVARLAGRLLALREGGCLPVELSDELEPLRYVDLEGAWPGSFSAHLRRDDADGSVHALAYAGPAPLRYVALNRDGRVTRVAPIGGTEGIMVHDLAITATSVIIMDLPVTFDVSVLAEGYRLPYRWTPERPARIGVLPRGAAPATVRWHDVSPCWVHHPINAYDRPDGAIVMDVIRHAGFLVTERAGWWEGPPTLDRWVLDPAASAVHEARIDDTSQEFPRIDDRIHGRPYRHAFCASHGTSHITPGPLYFHDLHAGTHQRHDFGPRRGTGEATFVPRSASAPEGDGWTISFVYDASTDRSDVVILDTCDFEGEPVAVVHLPGRVPFGAHGDWFADT